jgi:hypothetical protein
VRQIKAPQEKLPTFLRRELFKTFPKNRFRNAPNNKHNNVSKDLKLEIKGKRQRQEDMHVLANTIANQTLFAPAKPL